MERFELQNPELQLNFNFKNILVYEDPYENHFGDKAFLVKYCIYYYYYY